MCTVGTEKVMHKTTHTLSFTHSLTKGTEQKKIIKGLNINYINEDSM